MFFSQIWWVSKSRKEGGFPRGCNNPLLSGGLDRLLHEVLHLSYLYLLAVGDQLRNMHYCHWNRGWRPDCGCGLCGWQKGMLLLPRILRMENLHWHSTEWRYICRIKNCFLNVSLSDFRYLTHLTHLMFQEEHSALNLADTNQKTIMYSTLQTSHVFVFKIFLLIWLGSHQNCVQVLKHFR